MKDWKGKVSEEDAARVCPMLLAACGVKWRLNLHPSPNAPDGMPIEVDVWDRGFGEGAWPWRYLDWKTFFAGQKGWVNSFESDYGAQRVMSKLSKPLATHPGPDRVLEMLSTAGSFEELELRLEVTSR